MTTWVDPAGIITDHQFMKATVLMNALNNNLSMAMVCLARKTANESVTTNTTPQDDNDLFFTMALGELWYLRFIFRVSAGGAVDVDFKVQFDAPTDTEVCIESPGLNASGSFAMHRWFDTTTTATYDVTSSTARIYTASGLVYTQGAGGTFKVKWAQGNSSATATTLNIGSCILGTRLGVNPRLATP